MLYGKLQPYPELGLNESPSQKEGKCPPLSRARKHLQASMKALPKRKGNPECDELEPGNDQASMKALPKRKGNLFHGSCPRSLERRPQ